MAAAGSVFDEIDEIVASADKRRRIAMLRQVTNLFADKASVLDENLIAAFDEVLLRLARDLDSRVRHALSERFADIPMAPRKVVRDLAFDDSFGVAAPVLERSGRIEENDLVEIVEQKGPMHVLAISRRASVSERLCDSIIARGFQEAIRALTINEGARFSDEAFARLMQRSLSDPAIQDALTYRAEMTPEQVEALAATARDKVRSTLVDELGERMEQAIDAVVNDLTRKFPPERGRELLPADLEVSRQFVMMRPKEQKIDDAEIAGWVKRNRMEDVIAAMAQLSGVSLEKTLNAYYAPNYDAFLFIARSVGIAWPTFKAMLAKKNGRPPPLDVLETAYTVFQKLKPETAKRVVKFAVARGRPVPSASSRVAKASAPAAGAPAKAQTQTAQVPKAQAPTAKGSKAQAQRGQALKADGPKPSGMAASASKATPPEAPRPTGKTLHGKILQGTMMASKFFTGRGNAKKAGAGNESAANAGVAKTTPRKA